MPVTDEFDLDVRLDVPVCVESVGIPTGTTFPVAVETGEPTGAAGR